MGHVMGRLEKPKDKTPKPFHLAPARKAQPPSSDVIVLTTLIHGCERWTPSAADITMLRKDRHNMLVPGAGAEYREHDCDTLWTIYKRRGLLLGNADAPIHRPSHAAPRRTPRRRSRRNTGQEESLVMPSLEILFKGRV